MSSGFQGLEPCVHCGFCLQSCPTFLETGDEADGPRGRIALMRALARGDLGADDPGLTLHLDRCLGCRGCEPVCPSGVQYGSALEEARRLITQRRGSRLVERIVLAVMAEPALRRPLLGAARLVRPVVRRFAGYGRFRFAMGMLGATTPSGPDNGTAAVGRERSSPSAGSAAVFVGCIQAELLGHVNSATRRVLSVNGYRLVEVQDQGCCGALHAHAGRHDEALELARRNVKAFAGAGDACIAVNSAGCGAMLKGYGELFEGDPLGDQARAFSEQVADVSEVLARSGPRPGAALPLRAAWDPPCHLLHAQRVSDPPLAVLRAIPELTIVQHDEAELCCGSAGTYTLLQPELSSAVLNRKVAALRAANPDVVVTGNPGCTMQIGAGLLAAGLRVPVVHPVELLDRSYRAAGLYLNAALDSP